MALGCLSMLGTVLLNNRSLHSVERKKLNRIEGYFVSERVRRQKKSKAKVYFKNLLSPIEGFIMTYIRVEKLIRTTLKII